MVVPFAKVLFFSETLVVLYVKNNKILIFLIEYERDKDIANNYGSSDKVRGIPTQIYQRYMIDFP